MGEMGGWVGSPSASSTSASAHSSERRTNSNASGWRASRASRRRRCPSTTTSPVRSRPRRACSFRSSLSRALLGEAISCVVAARRAAAGAAEGGREEAVQEVTAHQRLSSSVDVSERRRRDEAERPVSMPVQSFVVHFLNSSQSCLPGFCSFGVAAPQGLFPFLGLSAGLCYFPAVPGYYLGVLDSLASFSCGGWVSRYLDHRLGTFAR